MNYGSDAFIGLLLSIIVITTVIGLALMTFTIIVTWKIYKKAGKPGWASLVPFYNSYVLYEITWGNGWYFLLNFLAIIPIIGAIAVIIINIITMIKLSNNFGKSEIFAVGLIFLNYIFLAIIAFDSSKFIGVINKKTNSNEKNNLSTNPFCTNCGIQLKDNASFCQNCGTKINK